MAAEWDALPPEIRAMILEMVSQPHRDRSIYAAVSREWQTFFEKRNFHRLILHQSCITSFDRIVRCHRRRLVKHIWLRVVLRQYDCRACQSFESDSDATNNNRIFTNAIWQVLKVLSSWKKKGQFGLANEGPVLELSTHSPSDSEHYFRDYRLDRDIYPRPHDENCTYEEYDAHMACIWQQHQFCDDLHGWADGARVFNPRVTAKLRVFGRALNLDFSTLGVKKTAELPSVHVVKGLLVRRQHFRGFRPSALYEILRSLAGFESVTLEPWRPIHYSLSCSRSHAIAVLICRLSIISQVTSADSTNTYKGQNSSKAFPSLRTITYSSTVKAGENCSLLWARH